MKINIKKFFNSSDRKRFFFYIFFILITIFSGCDNACETFDEMSTVKYTIKIDGNSEKYEPLKPQSYWESSKIFINKTSEDFNLEINIESNNLDLCSSDSQDFLFDKNSDIFYKGYKGFNFSSPSIDISRFKINVKKNDFIVIEPLAEEVKINDCANPPEHVYVHDVEKCKNGYTKADGSNKFIKKIEGTTIKLDSYIVNKDNVFNVITNYNSGLKILPGKKIIIPNEYEIKDGNITSYSIFPKIPGDHEKVLEAYARSPEELKVVAMQYWCRRLPSNNLGLIPTDKIDGYQLNLFCDNFYKFNNIVYESYNKAKPQSTMSVDMGKSKVNLCPNYLNPGLLPQINGNTGEDKMYSFVSNFCVNEVTLGLNDKINFPSEISKFLYGLQINSNNSSLNNDLYDPAKTDSGKFFGRVDAAGNKQIPINKSIKIESQGFVYPTFQISNFFGNYQFKIKKSCKAKKLHIYFSENGKDPTIFPPNADSSNSNLKIKSFDLTELDAGGNLINKDEIILNYKEIPNSGWMFFAIEDNGDGYHNNSGQVVLSVRVPKDAKDNFFNNFLTKTLGLIEKILFGNDGNSGVTNIIYKRIVKSELFRNLLNVFLLVFATSYGLMITMGLAQFQSSDLTKTALKIGFIYALLTPTSWEFFNKYLFDLFINGPGQLLSLILTPPDKPINYQDKTLVFGTVSEILGRLTDITLYKQIISLLFAGPFGWIAFIIIMISFVWLIYASFSAFIIYIVSIILISLFVSVAPLFIMTLMFKYTNKIFKAWLKVLISNALTLIFTFVGLFALGSMISLILNDIFSFGICPKCALTYDIGLTEICLMKASMPEDFVPLSSYQDIKMREAHLSESSSGSNFFYGLPIPLNKLLALYILSYIARKSINTFSELASELSDIGFGGPGGSGGISGKVEENFKYWGSIKKTEDLNNNKAFNTKGLDVELSDGKKTKRSGIKTNKK